MHTFQMNSLVSENGILSVTLPKEWAKQNVNVLLVLEPQIQPPSFSIVQPAKNKRFFETLCLDNDFADDELALLFERDKDTGREDIL